MITGNLNIDQQREIAAALEPFHRKTIKPIPRGVVIVYTPHPSQRVSSRENLRLSAALGLIVTLFQCLIRHYDGKSRNQQKKAQRIEQLSTRLMKRQASKISDYDLMSIGRTIDALNERVGFDNQPSWMVYISFSIAILSDVFPTLNKTHIHAFADELDQLLSGTQELHDYMSRKEKAQADDYDAKATELYSIWEGLF